MKGTCKKVLLCTVIMALLIGLAACGGNKAPGGAASGGSSVSKENFTPVEWRMSNQHPDGSIADTADREMIEEIREATEGRVNITLYNNNKLGDYLSVFDEVMVGSIEMHHGSTNEGYDSRVLSWSFFPRAVARLPCLC